MTEKGIDSLLQYYDAIISSVQVKSRTGTGTDAWNITFDFAPNVLIFLMKQNGTGASMSDYSTAYKCQAMPMQSFSTSSTQYSYVFDANSGKFHRSSNGKTMYFDSGNNLNNTAYIYWWLAIG